MQCPGREGGTRKADSPAHTQHNTRELPLTDEHRAHAAGVAHGHGSEPVHTQHNTRELPIKDERDQITDGTRSNVTSATTVTESSRQTQAGTSDECYAATRIKH